MVKVFILLACLGLFSGSMEENKQQGNEFILLVRLKTSQNQINAALATGNEGHAKEIRLKTEGMNRTIMKAFKKYFDYQVFFFYSLDYNKVKNKEFKGIFLNDKLERDSTIQPEIDDFYVSYWGNSPNLNMNVITLLNSDFEETGIWVRTFGLTPQNIDKVDPQVRKFKEKVQSKLPKYLQKKAE